jgi:alpha-galactosidase
MEDGSLAVGLFNRGDKAAEIKIAWADLGIKGMHKVRDLWRQKDMGSHAESFTSLVNSHGVVLVNVSQNASGGQ